MALKPRKKSRAAGWRSPVTVCIAATSDKHIVTVSDMKITTGYYSQDIGTLKLQHVHPRWRIMVSGKYGQRKQIVDPIMRGLWDLKKLVPEAEEVADICTQAYMLYAKRLA